MKVNLKEMEQWIRQALQRQGLTEEEAEIMARIYVETTKREVGHHDIHNLPSRLESLKKGTLNPRPVYTKNAAFGALERWDGDNGPGELICHFAMDRAVRLAETHGIGMCVMKNSNHYLCSAPYVLQAAEQGCIGFIIAKGVPSMGIPGCKGNVVGQSPIGYAFPAGGQNPVMLDICLAYVSGEELAKRARAGQEVPGWWGVDKEGKPVRTAAELMQGTKHPIGEHKGFGLAILCELLTGVLSGGLILDEDEEKEGIRARSTSHCAIAIKTDALWSREEYETRSEELLERLRNRSAGVHIPGDGSFSHIRKCEQTGETELEEELIETIKRWAEP